VVATVRVGRRDETADGDEADAREAFLARILDTVAIVSSKTFPVTSVQSNVGSG
jgi:hypothetical protein